MTILPDHDIGDTVYPRANPSSDYAGIVTGYIVRDKGAIIYLVVDAEGDESERYGFELTDTVQWAAPRDDDSA